MTDGAALQIRQRFEIVYCYKCRMPFAIPASIRADWQESGDGFYCPNGHLQSYSESDVQKLKKQLQNSNKRLQWAEQDAKTQRERADHNERRRRAEKAAKTRIKNRVGNGVCPCCNRTFQNLAKHMENKHPDYATETS